MVMTLGQQQQIATTRMAIITKTNNTHSTSHERAVKVTAEL